MTDSSATTTAPSTTSDPTTGVVPVTVDSTLWYNVGGFANLGLGVPNWGANAMTRNSAIFNLTQRIGRNLQALMFSPDSQMTTPPSPNAVQLMANLINRFEAIIKGRSVPEGLGRKYLSTAKASAPIYTFIVYPTPYFAVLNSWLKEYCGYILVMLEEAMQSQENNRSFEITPAFSSVLDPFAQRVKKLVATELLQVKPTGDPTSAAKPNLTDPDDPNFVITQAMIDSYSPTKWFNPTDVLDQSPAPGEIPSSGTIAFLAKGFRVSDLPTLTTWPGVS